ncbi:DUF6916 family protein [uncultured Roseibium sp.]|uniref:DUF6916 family protein n=1 Tax=uncultured Roseibium sp. TaxID=1936171 RepID=UPI0032166E5C
MSATEHLTMTNFEELKDRTFTVVSAELPVVLELVEVKKMGSGEREGGAFSVLWQGPSEPFLPQSIYRFSQAELGEHELFIVPVAEKTDGFQYESVFT